MGQVKRYKHKPKNNAERRQRAREAKRRYYLSPRGQYNRQKAEAKRKGIPWDMSFVEWCEAWENGASRPRPPKYEARLQENGVQGVDELMADIFDTA